jgi:hypothetical protein
VRTKLAGGAAGAATGGEAVSGGRDLDPELEGQHLAERRHGEVGARDFRAQRDREIRGLEAHRLAVHEAETLEHEHLGLLRQPERLGHPPIGGLEATPEEPRRHVLAERGEVPGKRAELQDVVVDGGPRDECPQAVPPGYQPVTLEQVERLAERHEGDTELAREASLIVQALAGPGDLAIRSRSAWSDLGYRGTRLP